MDSLENKYLAALEENETLRRQVSQIAAELELALTLLSRYQPQEVEEVEHHINHWDEGSIYA